MCRAYKNGVVRERCVRAPGIGTRKWNGSRREVLARALGASRWLPEASAAELRAPIRLEVSESTVLEVHLNDARAAGKMYLQRLSQENDIRLEYNPKILESSGKVSTEPAEAPVTPSRLLSLSTGRSLIYWIPAR